MRENEFEAFLAEDENISSKDKAVRSRLSKARAVEDKMAVNLDSVVSDDRETYRVLRRIPAELHETNGTYQNAVRKYYLFANGREFPTLNQFEKRYGITN
jgi:hypothetical protein